MIPAAGDVPTEVVVRSWGALTTLNIHTARELLVLLCELEEGGIRVH